MSDNVKPANSTPTPPQASRPNEHGTISVQGFLKIWDPATARVLVEKRA